MRHSSVRPLQAYADGGISEKEWIDSHWRHQLGVDAGVIVACDFRITAGQGLVTGICSSWSLEWAETSFQESVSVPIHELFLPIARFLRGLDSEEVVLMDEGREIETEVARPLNPWFGRTRSTSAQAQSSAASSSAPAASWTPLEPNSQPPLPPPLEPPSARATAASSSQHLPHPGAQSRLPVGRRLPAPTRSSSRFLE